MIVVPTLQLTYFLICRIATSHLTRDLLIAKGQYNFTFMYLNGADRSAYVQFFVLTVVIVGSFSPCYKKVLLGVY